MGENKSNFVKQEGTASILLNAFKLKLILLLMHGINF